MKRSVSILLCVLLSAVSATPVSAALVLHWQMNNPTPLDDSAGTNDLVPPGGANDPTHLPSGGVFSSGAYSFDGVNDRFAPTVAATNIGAIASSWTAGFWIISTDPGTSTPYNGTPHVPVLGDQTGAIGFGLGLHGGTAAFRHFNGIGPVGGWTHAAGTINVTDGIGHYVTFVHHGGLNTVDIYIDGLPDTLALPAGDNGGPSPYTFRDIGRSYNVGGASGWYALITLDDVRVYNTALTPAEILQVFGPPPVPEPSTLALLGLGAVGLAVKTRRRRAAV